MTGQTAILKSGAELATANDSATPASAQPNSQASVIQAEQVAEFLRNHPNFLAQQPELLLAADAEHDSGAAASLIERQVKVLREQNSGLQAQLDELIANARSNEQVLARLHELQLDLARAKSVPKTIKSLKRRLQEDFNIDVVEFLLFDKDNTALLKAAKDQAHAASLDEGQKEFAEALSEAGVISGRLSKSRLHLAFADQAAAIRSAAVIGLRGERPVGLLALGSHDENRFAPSGAGDLLARLGELIGCFLEARQ